MSDLWANVGALIPSLAVLAVFVVVVRAMILADRRERAARKREDEAWEKDRSDLPHDSKPESPFHRSN